MIRDSFITDLGGRKFLMGLAIATLCIVAGISGHLPMEEAIDYALIAFGVFAGTDAVNTWAHSIRAAQEAAANARALASMNAPKPAHLPVKPNTLL